MGGGAKIKKLGRRLLDAKRSIREKVLMLKLKQSGDEDALNKTYKPLIEPLKDFIKSTSVLKPPANIVIKTSPPSTPVKKMKLMFPQQSPPSGSTHVPSHSPVKPAWTQHSVTTPPSSTKTIYASPPPTALPQPSPAWTQQSITTPSKRGFSTPTPKPAPVKFLEEGKTFENSESNDDDDDDDDDESTVLEPDVDDTQERLSEEALIQYLEQFPAIMRTLLVHYELDTEKKTYDTSKHTGVNFNIKTSKIFVGNTELKLEQGGDITVGGKTFTGTKGLYELLFKKIPDLEEITKDDKNSYVDLLYATNAIYTKHDPNVQVQGLNSPKYRNIIKPILDQRKSEQHMKVSNASPLSVELSEISESLHRTGFLDGGERSRKFSDSYLSPVSYTGHTGSGFGDAKLRVENKPYRYMFWNDPNELVERLCFLHASKRAGNTSHENEIRAIEEELREADIIY